VARQLAGRSAATRASLTPMAWRAPSPDYRNRSGGGVLSSSGLGVALGSASGLGTFSFFFFVVDFFLGPVGTSIRRWRTLPVCNGIRISS